jgi:hypothetical protein
MKWIILYTLQGDILEDPANEPKEDMYMMSVAPENAPSKPEWVINTPSIPNYKDSKNLVESKDLKFDQIYMIR